MNCPRCGKPLPSGAAFCMHCGAMLSSGTVSSRQATSSGGFTAPPSAVAAGSPFSAGSISSQVRKRNTWLAVAISLAVILGLFFGLKAFGVLRFGSKVPEGKALEATGQTPNLNDLEARGSGTGAILESRGSGTPPTLESTHRTMPDNVRNWLNHLQECENQKRALGKKQEEEVSDMIGDLKGAGGLSVEDVQAWSDPDSTTLPVIEKVAGICRELQPAWIDLKTHFDSYPPPPECRSIADAYDQGLADIPQKMQQLDQIVTGMTSTTTQQTAQGARDSAREVGRENRKSIDEPFSQTDRLVQKICDQYQTRKWFSIDAHGGGSSILGF